MSRLSISVLSFLLGVFLIGNVDTLATAQVVKPKVPPKTPVPDPKAKTPAPKPPTPKPPPPMPKPPTPKPPEPEVVLPPAEEPSGRPSPFRLAQGLRDGGLADLGIQLLEGLKNDTTLDASERAAVPLELAKCKLALANDATEETVKTGLLSEARTLLDGFVKTNAKHARLAEANLSLAKLSSLEARNQLQKGLRLPEAEKKPLMLAARSLYVKSSTQYSAAAKELTESLKAMPDTVIKRNLQKDKIQAELDSAINQYYLRDTYPDDTEGSVQDRKSRSDALNAARKMFEALTAGPSNSPTVWIAKAWMAEIDTLQDKPEAKQAVEELNRASGGAAEAGRRLMKYFEIRRAYGTAGDPKSLSDLQALGRAWIARYDNPRKPTDEAAHVKYMVGISLEKEVRTSMGARIPKAPPNAPKGTPAPKMVDATNSERAKLREAERLFRDVAQNENEYSDRASDHRMTVVRLMIGETIRPPKEYLKFEDAHMAALVQMSKVREKERDKDDKAIKDARALLISLLERARSLSSTAESQTEVLNDQVNLAAMYLMAGRPYDAAVLGEAVTRTPRPASVARAAVAGELALAAYLASSAKAPPGPDGEEIRKSDRERAVAIGKFVEQTYPVEAATDAVRYRLGFLNYANGKAVEAFNFLSRIRSGFVLLNEARLMEGVIAHQLLSAADSPIAPAERPKMLNKAIADLEGVAPPEADIGGDKLLEYARLRIRLCLLYLIKNRVDPKSAPAYDKAESIASGLLKDIETYKDMKPEQKLEATLLASDLMTRSIYLQGALNLEKGQMDEVLTKIDPILKDVDKAGAASSQKLNDQPLEGNLQKFAAGYDADRRDVVLLALKAFIRKADVAKAKEQLVRLERLGGGIENNLSTLGQLVNEVRAQIASLKKDKPEEAKALSQGLTDLIKSITTPEAGSQKEIKPGVRVFAGQALLAVEQYADAAAILSEIPAASPAELMMPSAEVPENRKDAVRFYKAAALYRMRALRQAQLFAEADKLAAEVVGTAEKKGWGFNNTEYKREMYMLAEAKGAASASAPAKVASRFWGEAVQGWSQLAQLQKSRLTLAQNKLQEAEKAAKAAPEDPAINATLNQARGDVDRAKAAYFDFYFETSRASLEAYQAVFKADVEKMKAKYESEGKKIAALEFSNLDLAPEVQTKFVELLERDTMKDLRAAYEAAHAAEVPARLQLAQARVAEAEKAYAADMKEPLKEALDRAKADLETLKAAIAKGKMFIKKPETSAAAGGQ